MEFITLTAVTRDDSWAKLTIRDLPGAPGVVAEVLGALAAAGIDVDIIFQTFIQDPATADLSVTVLRSDVERARVVILDTIDEPGSGTLHVKEDISIICVEGVGMRRNAQILGRLYRCLQELEVEMILIQSMERKIICVVDQLDGERALGALRNAFQEYFTLNH